MKGTDKIIIIYVILNFIEPTDLQNASTEWSIHDTKHTFKRVKLNNSEKIKVHRKKVLDYRKTDLRLSIFHW